MKQIQTKEDFAATIKTGAVLVDFYAAWCGPCKMLAPILGEIAAEVTNVSICKLDIDEATEVATDQAVRALPTLVLFKDGAEVDRIVGFKGKSDLITWIKSKI